MAEGTASNCVFCRIVAGSIPCHKLYEDEQVLSFLDAGPLSRGHSLIIPRAHYATIDEMPADLVAACARLLPSVSRAVCATTGATDWNVLQNNGGAAHQAVPHVHFHIIPKYADGSGLGIGWPAGSLDDADAEKLKGEVTKRL